MVAAVHDALVDDVREILNRFLVKDRLMRGQAWSLYAAPALFRALHHYTGHLVADLYLSLPDGSGPVLVEVGRLPAGKWDTVYFAGDGRSVRVLHVRWDRTVNLWQARGSGMEQALLQVLARELADPGSTRSRPRVQFA